VEQSVLLIQATDWVPVLLSGAAGAVIGGGAAVVSAWLTVRGQARADRDLAAEQRRHDRQVADEERRRDMGLALIQSLQLLHFKTIDALDGLDHLNPLPLILLTRQLVGELHTTSASFITVQPQSGISFLNATQAFVDQAREQNSDPIRKELHADTAQSLKRITERYQGFLSDFRLYLLDLQVTQDWTMDFDAFMRRESPIERDDSSGGQRSL